MTRPLRVGTYNLHNYARTDDAAHCERVHEVIAALEVDVLMVQEVCGHGDAAIARLAEATGLSCQLPTEADAAAPAVAGSSEVEPTFHVVLLWNPRRIQPVAGSWRTFGTEMWHNLAVLDVTVDDTRLRLGSYHGPPIGTHRRVDEAARIVDQLTRPNAPAGIIGADWNTIPADRAPDGAYHHPEPYAPHSWRPELVHQCQWETSPATGEPARWWADRRAGETLLAGGLRDTVALSGRAHHPTTGHHPDDALPPRAIDTHRVTPTLTPAVLDYEVIDTHHARRASDHLPVVTTLELSQLG